MPLSASDSRSSTRRTPWLCGAIVILSSFGDAALPAPTTRLFEAALCRRYYESHRLDKFPPGSDIPEEYCKIEDIQIAVASTISIITVVTTLAELAMQLPMGILADQKGQRLALALNMTSTLCYWSWIPISVLYFNILPFWSVFLAPLFFLIGGGPRVSSALLFSTMADTAPHKKRTAYFSYLEAAMYTTDLISVAIGSFLMSLRLSIPFIVSITCYALSYVPIFFIVEAPLQPITEHPETFENSEDELLLRGDIEDEGDSRTIGPTDDVRKGLRFYEYSPARIGLHLLEIWQMVSSDRCIVLSLAVFFMILASRSSTSLLLQYVSKRYAWTIAQAGYLFSAKVAFSALLFLVFIPGVSIVFTKYTALGPDQISLVIAQISVSVLALGSLIIGLAPNIWVMLFGLIIFTLGSGAGLVLRSFLSAIVNNNYITRLYSVIGIVETLGRLLGTPFLAGAYSWGLKHGSWALGTPYLVGAMIYALAGITARRIRMPT